MTFTSENKGPSYSHFEAWVENKGQQCHAPILQVICKYRDIVMDKLPPGLPSERVINHTITLLPRKLPSKGATYRLGPEELEARREILQEAKDAKCITLMSSPFAAHSMIVGKKGDGTGKPRYRMVINYKELNAITSWTEYSLPAIQELLGMLHGAKVFTTTDTEQGFRQIPVEPHDQYKTAFRTCMGQYEFKVMPFVIQEAPGTFQAVMNHMLFPFIGRGVIAYLDDLLVYRSDVESHTKLLDRALQTLKDNKMYPKISKSTFESDAIEYLG